MTTYTVTTSNWNNVAFWNAINESGSGHELNFVSLPSTYSVTTDADSGVMAVSDGATIFTVSDSSFGGLSDVVLGGSTELAFFTVFTSGAGNDDIQLGAGDDQATGNAGEDTIDGGAGNDTLVGFTGNDSLYGDADNDSIVGGSGDDRLDGGTGNDTLEGGADADLLYGGFGDDHLAGGNGNDEIYTQVGNDTVFGGDGDDSVYGWYIDSNLEIHGEGGNDSLFGSSGNDTITGGVGNDTIEADNGADTIDGGAGDDRIYQYDGSATVTGGTGADLIDLGDDPDMVLVEDGFGNDTIIGGEGVSSGTDHDRIDFSALTTGISGAHVANAGTDIIVAGDTLNFSEIENIILTDQADSLDMLYESPVTVSGGAGNDTLRGSDFAGAGDSLLGGACFFSVTATTGVDTLHRDDANALLTGGAGNDTIDGGAGDDTILADFGINEVLIGGDGTDTYQIDESAAQAWAYDVNLNTGTDQYGRTFSEIENVIGG
ncbi:MAG: calcium-binding protein, partial [Sedimentitalea sp.]